MLVKLWWDYGFLCEERGYIFRSSRSDDDDVGFIWWHDFTYLFIFEIQTTQGWNFWDSNLSQLHLECFIPSDFWLWLCLKRQQGEYITFCVLFELLDIEVVCRHLFRLKNLLKAFFFCQDCYIFYFVVFIVYFFCSF